MDESRSTPFVHAGADTAHWGFFDAALPPVLEINSGDRVTISTVSGNPNQLPPPPLTIPPGLLAIHKHVPRKMVPGHICIGPVAVRGARIGQVLQVDIEDIEFHYDWGFNL